MIGWTSSSRDKKASIDISIGKNTQIQNLILPTKKHITASRSQKELKFGVRQV